MSCVASFINPVWYYIFMNHTLRIMLEISRRPHLWDTAEIKTGKIVNELLKDGIYSDRSNIKDVYHTIDKYVEVIQRIKKVVSCENSKQ